MKVLLVVNPSASGVTRRNRVMIQNALAAAHDLDVAETNRRGHATRLAQGAAAVGTDVVVALGGDGTVNEVANGLARTATALGVLPGGSTNVFARTIGLPNEPVDAAARLVAALDRGEVHRIGLGNVNGRFFCFHVGMGYDAAVVAQVERHGTLKRWLGHPLFIWAALDTWARRYDRRTPAFQVELGADGTVVRIDGLFALAMNSDPYTYLGPRPLSLVPEATLDAPLALLVLRSLGLAETLRAVGAALRGSGRLRSMRQVTIRTDLASFTVRGHRPFPWQVDGDHLGDTELLEFRYEPRVLGLVLPTPAA